MIICSREMRIYSRCSHTSSFLHSLLRFALLAAPFRLAARVATPDSFVLSPRMVRDAFLGLVTIQQVPCR